MKLSSLVKKTGLCIAIDESAIDFDQSSNMGAFSNGVQSF
jgi:hypothetical protein